MSDLTEYARREVDSNAFFYREVMVELAALYYASAKHGEEKTKEYAEVTLKNAHALLSNGGLVLDANPDNNVMRIRLLAVAYAYEGWLEDSPLELLRAIIPAIMKHRDKMDVLDD